MNVFEHDGVRRGGRQIEDGGVAAARNIIAYDGVPHDRLPPIERVSPMP
jgi:hypothetical protein